MPKPPPFPVPPTRLALTAAFAMASGFACAAVLTRVGAHYLVIPDDAQPVTYNDVQGPPATPGAPSAAVTSTDATEPDAADHPASRTPARRAPSSKSYDIIVRRNIFDSSAVYNPDVAVPGGGDCRDSSVKLMATIVADLPEYSSALISVSGGKDSHAQGFVIGDEVAGEGRITSIDQKKVCTDGGGCLCMGNDGALAKADATGGDPAADADSGITKVSDTKYLVDQSVVDSAMGNLEMLAAQVHASPHKGPDGQVDGYRLSAIRKGTLLDKLGIKNGDVVKAANGKPLNSTEGAMGAFQSLSSEKSFSFDITRRSQDTTIEYEIR